MPHILPEFAQNVHAVLVNFVLSYALFIIKECINIKMHIPQEN